MTFLMNITIIGITKSVPRMWMVFAISIAYSILGYAIVFKFVLNFQEFIYYKEENSKQSEDYKISKRTIMILNLPDYCSVYECNRTLHSFFKNRPDYMSVSTLGCYHPLYQILRDRIKIVSKLINAKSNPKTKQSKIEKLENQRNQKNYEAERALKNGISHNEGIAFVQFSTAKAANDFINNFFSLKRKYSYIQKYEKDQFSDIDYDALKTLPEDFDVCQWEVRIAPPSNDIIWENLSNRNKGIKTLYRFFTWFFLIIISGMNKLLKSSYYSIGLNHKSSLF